MNSSTKAILGTAIAAILLQSGCEAGTDKEIYPQPAFQEEVSVESDHGTLYGTLDLPADPVPVPVYLIIAGSGPTDRDGNSTMLKKKNDSLRMLGGWISSFGAATLRYDKRGVGQSKDAAGEIKEGTFEDMIADARLWVDLLKQDSRFSSVNIIGHSEGSLVGICAAQEGDVAGFISIAGAGRPIGTVIREQFASQPKFIRNRVNPILDELEEGRRVDQVPSILKNLFAPALQKFLISWMKYDPAEELKKLNISSIILQGTTDIQTSQVDARFLGDAGEHTTLVFVEGMNHILKDAPAGKLRNVRTYTKENLPLSRQLVEELENVISGQK